MKRTIAVLMVAAGLWLLPARACPQGQVRRVDVLILVYTRSFAHTLAAPELERLQEEVVEFADFYQRHGGDRVDFRFTLLQLDRELRRAEVSQVTPGRYYLSRENVEAELEALGMRGRFDEVVAFYAWDNANPDAAVLAYGGGAVGPDGHFLGDAGFNSIGVFAWDPARIAQIAVHEVLHNVDDMFSRSGMADAFFNSDEMSRNMSQLLRERPGVFLPYFSDAEMLAYAEREAAGKEMYPWWMQRIYYAWMLERTPASAWSALHYGHMGAARAPHTPRPLYDDVYLSRATRDLYLPLLDAPGRPRAQLARLAVPLPRREYALEDFDGTPLVVAPYHAGWLALPADDSLPQVRYSGVSTGTMVHRLRLGEVVAPAHVVSWSDSAPARFTASVREAGWPVPGPALPAQLALHSGTLALAPDAGGEFVVERGSLSGTITARLAPYWIAPAPIVVESRSSRNVHAPRTLEGTLATPLGLRAALRDDRPLAAHVTARVGAASLPLVQLPDGEYFATLPPLAPGLQRISLNAELSDHALVTDTVLVYGRPGGWIRTPTAVQARAGEPFELTVTVRSRMGDLLRGLRLPLIAVAGASIAPFAEDTLTGEYRARLTLPAGEHRIFVNSLEGDFQRRVVIATVAGASPSAAGASGDAGPLPGTLPGADGALPFAGAVRVARPPAIDGVLDEWSWPPLELSERAHLLTDSASYHGAADASARLWLAWDDSTLYLAGRVRDDSVTAGEAWDRDRVNLVFDWRENDTPLSYGEAGAAEPAAWQPDDQWLFFQPFWSDTTPGVPRRVDRTGTHPLPEATLRSQRVAGGYVFELAVPVAQLPEYSPYIGGVAALQLFLTDGDGEAGAAELMWSHAWRYSREAGLSWELPRMGRLVFTDLRP